MNEAIYYLIAGCMAAAGALAGSAYHRAPGAGSFVAICIFAAWSAFSASFEAGSDTLEIKLLWHNMRQAAFYSLSPAVVLMGIACLRGVRFHAARTAALLSIVPLCAVALIYTDSLHGWMRSSVLLDDSKQLLTELTTLGGFFVLGNVFVLCIGLLLLILAAATAGRNRSIQFSLLAAGLIPPLAACAVSGITPAPIRGEPLMTALAYIIGGIIIAAAYMRFRLFHPAPIPRNQLVDVVADGIVVLDGEGCILDQNEAAKPILAALSGVPARQLLGQPVVEQMPAFEPLFREYAGTRYAAAELTYGDPERRRTIAVSMKPVSFGAVLTLRDVTELQRIEREWQARAMTDGLTGISNRTGFLEQVAQLWAEAEPAAPLSLLLLDLDHFKSVNDRYGHQAGDAAIRTFVDAVLGVLAEPYLFGRIGGEEFALALPERTRRQAYETAERIRQTVEQTCLRTDSGVEVRCTVSIGIACRTEEDDTFDQVFAKADQSLYKAKQNGRNQTETA